MDEEFQGAQEPTQDLSYMEQNSTHHLGWALFCIIVLFTFLLGVGAYMLLSHRSIRSTPKETPIVVEEVPTETTDQAAINIHDVLKSQIIADVSIMLGKTFLLKEHTRPVVFEAGDDEHRATTAELLAIIAPSAPKTFINSVDSEFESGVISTVGQTEYFIFTSKSYANTFAAMLQWEKTFMNEFIPIILPWSLPEAKGHDRNIKFTDKRVGDTDTRVVTMPNGKVLVIYGFPKKDKLLIAGDEDAFLFLSKQLNTEKGH